MDFVDQFGDIDIGIGASSPWGRAGSMLVIRLSKGVTRKGFAHVSSDLATVLTDTGVSSIIVEPDSRQTLLHRLGFVACS